ncbi:MAG: twin-arginine translocase subunit TatC, partial [Ichthyobacteriaceae bacterium]|nr:twin-arginine translocase subunit TatC [Ichthyobacteriaceae bacterium]
MAEEKEMSFLGHLEILRWHIIRSFAAIFVFAVVAFFMKSFVFDTVIFGPKNPDFFTYEMLCKISVFFGFEDSGGMCFTEMPFVVQNRTMAGQFTSHLWVSLISGFIIAFPYILWEMWSFLKPGLTSKEKGYTNGVVFFSSILFIIGVLFGYYLIAPLSINFLGGYSVSAEILNEIDLGSYISTVSTVTLSSGLVFELPIIIYFLSKMGVITPTIMREYRKHSLVGVLVLSAIITPPDISSQILVSIPIMVLYEMSIYISAIVLKNNKAKE